MRTVIATSFTPTLDSGRARRTYGVVAALARHGEVDLVYGRFGADRPDRHFEALPNIAFHAVDRPGRVARLPAYVRARSRGIPDDFARGIWPGIPAAVEKLVDRPDRERVRIVAEGPVVAAALLPLAAQRPACYCSHNLESSFRHQLEESGMSRQALERFERLLLEHYAESWMVSEADMKGAAALAPGAGLRLVPNVVDVAATEPVEPRGGRRAVAFVADLGYEPNRDGLAFLLEEAMPEVWRRAADVELLIAGKGSDRIEASDPRVRLQGFVENLRDVYDAAGAVMVPLREGGGSPLKFVEALAYGLPVVATPLAAQGLEIEAGADYFEAPAEGVAFAEAIVRALDPELGDPVARAGHAVAEERYSIEALERCLDL
ncbi:MAG TPA: glycosyltransferase [Solirubrobacterales bacterium]|jgi:glycosyltransferase involved in cell wall biosynthesis|nr:glycosyltransferase [Solirubrobacterales bacterium]